MKDTKGENKKLWPQPDITEWHLRLAITWDKKPFLPQWFEMQTLSYLLPTTDTLGWLRMNKDSTVTGSPVVLFCFPIEK